MFPCSPTLDHVGILARDATGIAHFFATLTDPAMPRARTLHGARIGVQRRYFLDGCAADVSACFDAALRLLEREGAVLIDVDAPDVEATNPLASLVIMVEAAARRRRRLKERAYDYLSTTRARLATGFVYTGAEYRAALAARVHFLRRLGRLSRNERGGADVSVTFTWGAEAVLPVACQALFSCFSSIRPPAALRRTDARCSVRSLCTAACTCHSPRHAPRPRLQNCPAPWRCFIWLYRTRIPGHAVELCYAPGRSRVR
jgi:hypothetical protein